MGVWLRKSSHRIHRIHRSLGVLLAAWVWQDAIPSYICVNPCYLWETLLYKKVLCRSVKSVGEYHSEKVL